MNKSQRPLSREAAEHDHASAKPKREGAETRHQKDKRQHWENRKSEFTATIAIGREAGSGVIEPVFDPRGEKHSFCFEFYDGKVCRSKDDAAYIRRIIKLSKERARYKRKKEVTLADGTKELRPNGYGHYRAGVISVVTTVPPWWVGTIKRLEQNERDLLMLGMAQVVADQTEAVSQRACGGGAAHYDSCTPHLHSHVFLTDETGNLYPKSKYLTIGPTTVGWDRIVREFGEKSGLVEEYNLAKLRRNLAKKYSPEKGEPRPAVDIEVARAVDAYLAEWLLKNGEFRAGFERDRRSYYESKTKALKLEQHRRLMQEAVNDFSKRKVWPLAYRAMSRAMFRMIPKEIRGTVLLSIRAHQIVRRPLRYMLRSLKEASLDGMQYREMTPLEITGLRVVR